MKFEVEFTTRAVKDLKGFSLQAQRTILEESLLLETAPFPHKKKIKKIHCYTLRIDLESDSLRLFYGINKDIVYVLRIVSKKDADKIIKSIRKTDFPPHQ